jgi:uncharacterized RDD family membrane protein YckC
MHCKHCGFANGEDDHRCLRCGRRVRGVVIAAPPGYSGANALAVGPGLDDDSREMTLDTQTGMPAQAAMFTVPSPKVIPFDRIQRQATGRNNAAVAAVAAQRTAQRKTVRPAGLNAAQATHPTAHQTTHQTIHQTTLDFIPALPSANRKLKTNVDAQIFCDSPVATPTHRFVASAIDAALILLGFGVTALSYVLLGGSFGAGRMFWTGLGGTLALVAVFYGLVWAIAGRETFGMAFTDLRLITFDGFPLDGRNRALRFASSWLSFCSGGLGLIWAAVDEESLTWHDHISKTFPTIRETPRSFVKQRR